MKAVNALSQESARIAAIETSDYVNAYILGGAAVTVTVPTGATVAAFSSTTNFFANWKTTATVPGANITNGTSSELNPSSRAVIAGGTFSVIAPAAGVLTIAFYNR